MKRQSQLPLIALALLVAVGIPRAAQAQFWNQPKPTEQGQPPQKRVNTYKADPHAFDTQALRTPPDLPYFPSWTGAKPLYVEGLTFPRRLPKEIYTMTWQYKEPAGVIINWYTEALPQAGWKVDESIARANVVTARHMREDIDVSIQVSPAARNGYKTTAEIRYTKHPERKKR